MDTGDTGIGARARRIRRRRGLSQAAVAGLAGISKGYLSKLETGAAQFSRRGLIEDLADALGCAPAELTLTATAEPDRRALVAASALPALTAALYDTTLDDHPEPECAPRPLDQLVDLTATALADADNARFDTVTGHRLGDLVLELHVHAHGARPDIALETLVSACIVGSSLAATLGRWELAVTASRRGWEAARRLDRADLAGFMTLGRSLCLNRIGARHRAITVLTSELADLATRPTTSHTAQALGMLHLTGAQLTARNDGDVEPHLREADRLSAYTGEANHMRFHFGPTNVAVWKLAVAVERGRGPEQAARIEASDVDLRVLESADRRAAVHLDLARAYAQHGADDDATLRHLDQADRIAPLRVRCDPIARELVAGLDRRARRRNTGLESMKLRLGVA